MKYSVTSFLGGLQDLAGYLRRELQRISNVTDSYESEGWQDLRFPAQGINPTGSAAPPAVDSSTSAYAVPGSLLFSGTLENDVAGIAQFPHGYVPGQVEPHIHCRREADSTDAVAWKFYYKVLGNPGDPDPGVWQGPLDGTVAVGDFTSAYEHCIVTFERIELVSYYDSVVLAWRVTREGNSDAYAEVVRLLEFDIHYRARGFGSRDIYGQKQT